MVETEIPTQKLLGKNFKYSYSYVYSPPKYLQHLCRLATIQATDDDTVA